MEIEVALLCLNIKFTGTLDFIDHIEGNKSSSFHYSKFEDQKYFHFWLWRFCELCLIENQIKYRIPLVGE